MKIKEFWLKWKDATSNERLNRFKECEKIFNEQCKVYNENKKAINPWKTNNFGELLALQSLCENDALKTTIVYHESKWITDLISGMSGETPTEAYENVEKTLSKIDGIIIHKLQDRTNANIVFDVITTYYTYTYETRYHIIDKGDYVVCLHCLERNKRQCSNVEWLMYIDGLTKEQAEEKCKRNEEFEQKYDIADINRYEM